MLVTICFIIAGLAFVKYDLVFLYDNEQWVAFFLYLALLSFGLVLAVLYDLGVTIPSPVDPIEDFIELFMGG